MCSTESAARAVKQILESQKKSKTEWKKHDVKDASGDRVPAYLNPDKNSKTIKGEIALRRVFNTLKKLHPELGTLLKQSKLNMQCSIDWVPLVRVKVESPSEISLVWNDPVATRNKIKQAEVETDVGADLGAGANIQWTKFG